MLEVAFVDDHFHDIFLPLVRASKEWKVQKVFLFTDEDWAGLAKNAGTGHIGTVVFDPFGEEKIKRENVKAIWEIAERVWAREIEIGGGRREDPKTTWEEACEELKNIFSD